MPEQYRNWLHLLYTFRGLLSDAVISRAAEEMGRRPAEIQEMLREAAWAWEAQDLGDDHEAEQ